MNLNQKLTFIAGVPIAMVAAVFLGCRTSSTRQPEDSRAHYWMTGIKERDFAQQADECMPRLIERIRREGFDSDDDCWWLINSSLPEDYPRVFRVWVETCDPAVLVAWMDKIYEAYELHTGFAKCLSQYFPQLMDSITTDQALEQGLSITIDVEGTLWSPHQVVVFNPIPAYEKEFGKGSWPNDLPLERLKAPCRYKKKDK